MEVVIKQNSGIVPSKKDNESSDVIAFEDIQERRLYDVVTVQGKVHSLGQPHTMENGSERRDVIIVDRSGSHRVSVWGDAVGTVVVGSSYLFMIQRFSGQSYLTMRRGIGMFVIETIEDLVNGADVSAEDALVCDKMLRNAEIPEFVQKRVCRRTSGVMPGPPTCGNCLHCGMVQKYELCTYPKLMFASEGEEDIEEVGWCTERISYPNLLLHLISHCILWIQNHRHVFP